MILPFKLRYLCLRHLRRVQHILNEDPVPYRRIIDHNVGHRADQLAVLYDGTAAHECGKVGTTVFNEKFIFTRI